MEFKLGYFILAYFALITIVAFILMGIDKRKAKKGAFRISEASLFITALLGGSLGSVVVNQAVRSILPELLKNFQVIHLCGKDKVDESLKDLKGYVQFEYIQHELKDLFALADIVISRAGANAICELLALHKPNLLIPLSANASRGDQILNARSFERQGFSMVLEEEELNDQLLLETILSLYHKRDSYITAMKNSSQQDSIDIIIELIEESSKA